MHSYITVGGLVICEF